MAKIGYARVSTDDQHPEAQIQELIRAGCEPDLIFVDKGVSGATASRPAWNKCLAQLRKGDVLVAVKLDRFSRSALHFLTVLQDLKERGVYMKCLDLDLDTSTPIGEMVQGILIHVAQFEKALISERTRAGLKATKARGRSGGRKKRLTPTQVEYVKHLHANGYSIGRIQDELANGKGKPGRATIYRALGMTSDSSYQEAQAQ